MELVVVHERMVRKMGNAAAGMIHLHHGAGVAVVGIVPCFYAPGMRHVLLVQRCRWLQG